MYIENHTKHWIFDNLTPSNYFNLQCVLFTSYIWFLILPGEHNATYTVAPSQEGLKFTKIRHGHPVQYARANYSKVTSDQPDGASQSMGLVVIDILASLTERSLEAYLIFRRA